MIGRFKTTVFALTRTLRRIEADTGNHSALLELQFRLIKLIKRGDRRMVTLRLKRAELKRQKSAGRCSKAEATALKKKIGRVEASIEELQRLQFFWRCFGDGIAFVYCDKHALKHMFFNAHNYEVKQAAGALIDKVGFALEWRIVQESLKHIGVPAMLCDLTNIVRHGDVCILWGPDPLPMEVKSSANRNARSVRQEASLTAIGQFLRDDEAARFRGIGYVRRVAIASPRNHRAAMNRCIARAQRTGVATVSPEAGVTYACARLDADLQRVVKAMRLTPDCLTICLNEVKQNMAWRYYYPFTLSLRAPGTLYGFLHGDFLLIVILRMEALIDVCGRRGTRLEPLDQKDWIFALSDAQLPSETAPRGAISTALLMRSVFDFDSPEDLCSTQLASIADLRETPLQTQAWNSEPTAEELSIRPRLPNVAARPSDGEK